MISCINEYYVLKKGKKVKAQPFQKQPFRSVPAKRCYGNMQQIYRGTPMPKCHFHKAEIYFTLRHGYSPVNLLHIFRTNFCRNTSGWLLPPFPHSNTKNMFDYIKTLLKKFSDNGIQHIGTNDSVNSPSKTVLDNILSLKHFIET